MKSNTPGPARSISSSTAAEVRLGTGRDAGLGAVDVCGGVAVLGDGADGGVGSCVLAGVDIGEASSPPVCTSGRLLAAGGAAVH